MIYDSIKRDIFPYIAPGIREHLEKISKSDCEMICEIRIGKNMPISLSLTDTAVFLGKNGKFCNTPENAVYTENSDFEKTLELMTKSSVYAAVDEIKRGFITLCGGYRVGICGRAVLSEQKISYIKDISFLSIRIKREVFGCADALAKFIADGKDIKSTLIIGPPHSGKTTVIRDLARILSDLFFKRVAIADERGEIAAMYRGNAQNNVGKLTCVMDLCPKKDAVNMLIRSMSPDVIITDEIGGEADLTAVRSALLSGVGIIATRHGKNFSDVKKLLPLFDCAVLLSRENVGKIQKIIKAGDEYV